MYLLVARDRGVSERAVYLEKDGLHYDRGTVLQERHPVPSNFRRLLTSKLKALAMQGKLTKVGPHLGLTWPHIALCLIGWSVK